MDDFYLTTHFKLSEFYNSDEYPELVKDNYASFLSEPYYLVRAMHISYYLESLRRLVGCPIRITSGYRYPPLNKAVGGVNGSQHLKMQAVDITCKRLSALHRHLSGPLPVFVRQVILYDSFIHIGFFDIPVDSSNVPVSVIDKRTFNLN